MNVQMCKNLKFVVHLEKQTNKHPSDRFDRAGVGTCMERERELKLLQDGV